MNFSVSILIFLLGLAVGSFLNVCIYRIPRKESIIAPASHCPKCSHRLRFFENIPLLSFLFLRGRCRYCKKPISFQYPVIELLTALMFLAAFSRYSFSWKTPVALFFASVLFLSGAIDIRHKIIPNKVVFPALGVGLFLLFVSVLAGTDFLPLVGVSGSVLYPLLGLVLGGGILFIPAIIREDWMGAGDVKFTALIGLFLGGYVLLALFLGSLIGSVYGITLILLKRIKKRDTIPFGPFLALGALITLFFGPQIFYFYLSFWG